MHISHIRRALKSLGLSTCMALAATLFVIPATPSTASAQVVLSVTVAPPVLPVYTQPVCPGDGYIWTPGYWSYSDDGGYFWVPGTWVEPPTVGLLWTPGYWGWSNGAYLWNAGYWGPEVGFYGGINYGFGYVGTGYYGGRWDQRPLLLQLPREQRECEHRPQRLSDRPSSCTIRTSAITAAMAASARGPTAAQERFAHEQHTAPTVSARAARQRGAFRPQPVRFRQSRTPIGGRHREARRIPRRWRSADQSVRVRPHRQLAHGDQIRSHAAQRKLRAHRNQTSDRAENGNHAAYGIKACDDA